MFASVETDCGKTKPRIVLAVTTSQSLRLMTGFPDYLATKGWDVHVVCSDPPDGPDHGWTTHRVRMRRDPAPLPDLRSLLAWIRLLHDLRPDTVVAGTPKAGLLGTLAAAITRVPTRIYLLRGLRSTSEKGLRRRGLNMMESLTMAAATEIQSVSPSLKAEVVELGLCSEQRISVVGSGSSNGVELVGPDETSTPPMERRAQLGLPERPTIGFIGRLHPDKGLDVLFGAFGAIAQVSNAQLLLVGAEEPTGQFHAALAQLPHSLHERVIWLGRKDDPTPYYRAMDVLALPSKREGFPNVVLEAAARRVATVTTDVTGCRDAVHHGRTGLLVAPDNREEFAEATLRILNEPEFSDSLAQEALIRAASEFSRETVWAKLDTHYRARLTTEGTRN